MHPAVRLDRGPGGRLALGVTRRSVGTDRVRPAITSALSPEVKMAAAPQSFSTKATSSAVSITLIGLTTAPARSAAW